MLASHYGIINADAYSDTIESFLESVFIKDEHIYLVIQINQDEEINAFDLHRFLDGITFFYQEFCKDEGIEPNEELTIKIKLQSEGKTILKALVYVGIIGLLGLITLCNNNEIESTIGGVKIKGKSEGFLKTYEDFLERDQKRKEQLILFNDSLQKLKANNKPIEGEPLKDNTSNQTKENGEK